MDILSSQFIKENYQIRTMATPVDNTTLQIKEKLKTLHTLVHEIEKARAHSEETLENLEKVEEEILPDVQLTSSKKRRLKVIYNKSIDSAKEEITVIGAALDKIEQIRNVIKERRIEAKLAGNKETLRRVTLMKMLLDSAVMLPLFIRHSPEEEIPPLCGRIPADPSYIAEVGDYVAALVKTSDDEENWILAEVIEFIETTNKYEVDDVDAEDKTRHVIHKRRVVPLPIMKVNPETEPEALYDNQTEVMALFPQTTCFYPAVIDQKPTSVHDDYQVLFVDPVYPEGYSPGMAVPQRFVITVPDIKSRAKTKR